MNFDEQIKKIVVAIKGDKAIIQPWRNKAAARLEEAQAFVRMGKTSAPARLTDEELSRYDAVSPVKPSCICPPDALDTTCPFPHSRVN